MKKLLVVPFAVGAIVCVAALPSRGAEPSGSANPSASTASSASASTGASASAAPSASASAKPPPPPPITQSVPTTSSEAPKAEWDSAPVVWSAEFPPGAESRYRCEAQLVREWLKLRCEDPTDVVMFGAVWGMAGDLKGVTASVPPRATTRPGLKPEGTSEWQLEKYKRTIGMGGRAEVVVPLRPGSAALVELGRMGWDSGSYGDSFEVPFSGPLLETSWAKGEASPRVVLEGVVIME